MIILAIAFLIRLYATESLPLVYDEREKVEFVKKISFNLKNLNLPVRDRSIKNPLLSVYILKLGFTIFGENKFSGRFFFVLLGTLSLYFIYKLVKENLEEKTALLTLLFLTFSQFHIGTSRLIDEDCLLLFFSSLSLYLFFKALKTGKSKWVYLTGIVMGVGYLGKEVIILLLPVFLIFIISERKYREWFKGREIYFAFLIMFILISPHLIWSFKNNFYDYTCEDATKIGLSLRSFYLYFAEVFAKLSEKFNVFYWDILNEKIFICLSNGKMKLISVISNEFPFVHWVLSIMIFMGLFYCFKYRGNELIRFCLIMFSFIFIVTSMVGPTSLLDNHWWASMTIYPGVILCAHMLVKLKERYRLGNLAVAGIVGYFIVHSLYFVNLPENQFAVPKDELCKYYLKRAETYLQEGMIDKAIDRCKWVIKRCSNEKILKEAREILTYAN